MENEKTLVKDWYIKEYTTDELGQEINEKITFYDIFYALDRYKNIYEVLGVGDSLVRERVFKKLADIMKVEYNYIYEQWLLCDE
jgi:hypothetical protein